MHGGVTGKASDGLPMSIVIRKTYFSANWAFATLTALLEFVGKELKAGKTKEQIMLTTSIPGADQWTGDGIERSLTAALEELTGE